jgi:MYXO-CTERM domain-containing protein
MLQLLALPLLLASFGAEREISTPVAGPNPGGTGIYQLLARPGGGFTALYQDGRGYQLLFDQETVGLRLARLSSTLQVQDPTGLPLPLPRSTWQIAALQDATGISLISSERSPTGSPYTEQLMFRRITEAGAPLLGPVFIEGATDANVQSQGELAIYDLQLVNDGTRFIAGWLEAAPNGDTSVKLAAIDAHGTVTGPWTLATDYLSSLALATSGGDTVAVWSTYRGSNKPGTIDALRLSAGQAPAANPVSLLSNSGAFPALVGIASKAFYLAWQQQPATSNGTDPSLLVGAPLSAAGTVGIQQTLVSMVTQYALFPQLAFSGTDVRLLFNPYLAISTRTVPLSGAPSAAVQTIRSGLGFAPGPVIACNGAACALAWDESAPAVNGSTSSTRVTRLGADSSATDLPAPEISFAADSQGAPRLIFDGANYNAVYSRTMGRGYSHLLLRRLTPEGSWLDAAPFDLGIAAGYLAAPITDGGVLMELDPGYYSDAGPWGFVLRPGGPIPDGGAASGITYGKFTDILACGAARCGALIEDNGDYYAQPRDLHGEPANGSYTAVPALNGADNVNLIGAGTSIVAVYHGNQIPYRAIISPDQAFPAFGAPIALDDAGVYESGDVHVAMHGNQLALVWSDNNTCRIAGRVLDLDAGVALGAGQVTLHDCDLHVAVELGIVTTSTGYRVLYAETGADDGGPFTATYIHDTDFNLVSSAAEKLLDRSAVPVNGLSLTRINGADVFAYNRFDDDAGVGALRAKLAGLDGGEQVIDAGPPDAGTPDAGIPDAGNPDAGDDAGTRDAGEPDGGNDAGVADAGTQDAGSDAGQRADAGDSTAASGCGCSSTQGTPGSLAPAAVLFFGIIALRRRRQRS